MVEMVNRCCGFDQHGESQFVVRFFDQAWEEMIDLRITGCGPLSVAEIAQDYCEQRLRRHELDIIHDAPYINAVQMTVEVES